MLNITLRQLEYLVTAAEEQSVTAAARRLFLSQSALSTSLADLEEALNVQVFVRHARGITLTNSGKQVVLEARKLLAGVNDLQNLALESSSSLTGRLVVGCYATFSPVLLPEIIAKFAEDYPGVELSFVEGSKAGIEEALLAGTVDIALLYGNDFEDSNPLESRDLTGAVVDIVPPHVLLPADHRLAAAPEVALADLEDDPLVLFDLQPGADYFLSLFRSEGLTPQIRFRTQSYEMVRALVARGLGYALLSQRTRVSTSYEGLPFVAKPLAGEYPGLTLCLVHLAGVRLTRRVQVFAEVCHTLLGGGRMGVRSAAGGA